VRCATEYKDGGIACWQGLVSRYGFDPIIEMVKHEMRQCDNKDDDDADGEEEVKELPGARFFCRALFYLARMRRGCTLRQSVRGFIGPVRYCDAFGAD
jgi:hypothetical protein